VLSKEVKNGKTRTSSLEVSDRVKSNS